jgi:hypothetical protein
MMYDEPAMSRDPGAIRSVARDKRDMDESLNGGGWWVLSSSSTSAAMPVSLYSGYAPLPCPCQLFVSVAGLSSTGPCRQFLIHYFIVPFYDGPSGTAAGERDGAGGAETA